MKKKLNIKENNSKISAMATSTIGKNIEQVALITPTKDSWDDSESSSDSDSDTTGYERKKSIDETETTQEDKTLTSSSSTGFTEVKYKKRKAKETDKPVKETDKPVKETDKPVKETVKAIVKATEEPVKPVEDFPSIDKAVTPLSKKEKRAVREKNTITVSATPIDLNTSTEAQLKRTAVFNKMKNKGNVATALVRSRVCRNVTTRTSEGDWGVCTREYCTFCHGEDEWTPPVCGFDKNCYHKFGNRLSNGSVGPACKFKHSGETISQYLVRAGISAPEMPKISTNYRKPEPHVKTSPVKPTPVKPTLGPPPTQRKFSSIPPPAVAKMSRWDQPKMESPAKPPAKPTRPSPTKRNSYRSSRKYYSSDSDSDSDSDSYASSRRRRGRSYKSSPAEQVIRVPTKELAEFVTLKALERGTSVRVIIDA